MPKSVSTEKQLAVREKTKLWLSGAVGFIETAYSIIYISKTKAVFHWPAFYVNLGYAYELSLKGFLANNGWNDEKLRKEIGHDLQKALSESRTSGFVPHSIDVSEAIDVIGPLHKSQSARYLTGEALQVPADHEDALRVASDHLNAVGDQLGISDWD